MDRYEYDIRMKALEEGVDLDRMERLEKDLERAERRIDFLLDEIRALRKENDHLRRWG